MEKGRGRFGLSLLVGRLGLPGRGSGFCGTDSSLRVSTSLTLKACAASRLSTRVIGVPVPLGLRELTTSGFDFVSDHLRGRSLKTSRESQTRNFCGPFPVSLQSCRSCLEVVAGWEVLASYVLRCAESLKEGRKEGRKEGERESSSATPVLGGLCRPLVRGGGRRVNSELCTPGELFRSTQWCLSSTSVATLLKRPLALSAPLQILKEAPLRGWPSSRGTEHTF